jgi:hypothetical protein
MVGHGLVWHHRTIPEDPCIDIMAQWLYLCDDVMNAFTLD